MPQPSVSVTSSGPGLVSIMRDLRRLAGAEVLVGIPAAGAGRAKGPINNAALLWLHAHGSPLRHIPARPVLEPAVEGAVLTISPHMENAARLMLEANPAEAERELKLAGTIAANACKRYVRQGHNLAPNAPSTIRRKKSDRPLVDTGSMISAITYVVRTEDRGGLTRLNLESAVSEVSIPRRRR